MEKYKLLIVDDESDVREAIVERIDWDALGYEVVAEAENGQDALEKAELSPIDVALTDIKMPFMDGLEMGARLSQLYPGVKIIILSGFDEFEYAKAAIKLNVVEYVLKPVNVAELSEVLRRVKSQLDDSIAQRRNIDMLQESYKESLPLMRERFLTELMWGAVPDEEIDTQLARYDLAIGGAPYSVVAVFEPDRSPKRPPLVSWELVPLSIKQIVEELFEQRCGSAVFTGSSAITAVTSWDDPDAAGALVSVANEICSRCLRVLEVTVTAGVGRARRALKDARHSFQEARLALEYKTFIGTGKAIYIQDMERVRREADMADGREEEQLISAVKFGSKAQFEQCAVKIHDSMAARSEFERRAYALSVYGAVYRMMQHNEMFGAPDVNECVHRFMQSEPSWGDPVMLKEWLMDVCDRMSGHMTAKRKTAARNLAEEAKRFIDSHYHEQDLSVDTLCKRLHVSQSYFSTSFKHEMGISFVQYLTNVRLDRAVDLLRKTDDKTYEIASRVGYAEPNYFSYAFKKHFGVSPTKYRGKLP